MYVYTATHELYFRKQNNKMNEGVADNKLPCFVNAEYMLTEDLNPSLSEKNRRYVFGTNKMAKV